jgi:hypothetical protein
MKQVFFLVLLVLSSESAFAEWVTFTNSEDGSMTYYVDKDSERRKGNKVKMWVLKDLKVDRPSSRGKGNYLSAKNQLEFDCLEEQHRMLAALLFSGNMGHGSVIESNTFPDGIAQWRPTSPGSIAQTMLNFACDKK